MSLPQPHLVAGRTAVRRTLDALPADALVVVACSGGADSLALAACLAAESRGRPGLRAGAVIVDHGLQDGSAEVAQRAAEQCRELGLAPVRVRRAVVGDGPGPEAAARDARYAAIAHAAPDAAAVLLGHTLDDQAETVLLRLARGAGARSLAGMAVSRGALRRPFLGLRRADTEAICAELGLAFWEDPTNSPPTGHDDGWPLRSQVRRSVLPVLESVLGPGVPAALARSAEQLREDDDALHALALASLSCARDEDASGLALRVAELADAATAVRRRVLRLAALEAGAPAGSLTRTHVLELDALVTAWHGQGPIDLPGRIRASRACGRLILQSHRP